MRLAFLKTSIKLFGLVGGFKQWYTWEIKWPVQKFIWLNITHRSYCTYHGYHCESFSNGECKYPKLTKKQDIIEHWRKDEEESRKIIQGPNGECAYCGEFPGRKLIPDPNMGLARWNVCITCDKVITAQHKLSFGILLMDHDHSKEYGRRVAEEAQKEIDFLSAESFTPSISVLIKKREK